MYENLLFDEQQIKFKPKLGYMQIQKDINEQMRAILWIGSSKFIIDSD